VVFILCTTEAHKIPATIASRCQHFSFRSVEFDDLIERMRFICGEEGIEADPEALAVLAQAGEGSVRDSLSALDQAIACCGNKLDAELVRGLLGAFSLDALAQVSQSLIDSDNRKMLEVVNELERDGHNLQHFSRELSRYFRNLLVAKISGRETRLIAASPRERERMAQVAAAFSEEDLTRYLQLSLDLFRDLQFSLQPRFHLEIGLLKMIHAGRLIAIEEAIAGLGATSPAPHEPPEAAPKPPPKPAPPPPARTGPSPFEMDQIKKGMKTDTPPSPPAEPLEPSEWRERLHAALMELSMPYTADAIEHSRVTASDTEIAVQTPKEYSLAINVEELQKAVRHLGGSPMRVKLNFTDEPVPEKTAPVKKPDDDEITTRALGNPEVQRFRELFGGEVRTVRNLKE
ncbi:MAG: DNA polymerase III subunit gamma/tau, partial [Acidobacteriota bacterium]|nr:DNA polymerase III subunit gamma/tau [Acidobacteriota bacterium]